MPTQTCRDCGNPYHVETYESPDGKHSRIFTLCHAAYRIPPDWVKVAGHDAIMREQRKRANIYEPVTPKPRKPKPAPEPEPEPDVMDIQADVEQVLADAGVEPVAPPLCVDCGLYPPQSGYDSGLCIGCAAHPGRTPGTCAICENEIKSRDPLKYAYCYPCNKTRGQSGRERAARFRRNEVNG